LLMGMGGSSLCPEVLRRTFGARPGYPELLVLDSTVPSAVLAFERRIDVERTLFIVASKSGTTTEPQVFYDYFFDKVARVKGDRAGENFVAITDPDTLLARIAEEKKFRRAFLNPSDIGGRYSALSYFGMVPAALAGLDITAILDRAGRAMSSCRAASENPGLDLGVALGVLARRGRDKLTFAITPPVDSLGLWIEQLVAESTGKEGVGILPVVGEPLADPEVYGNDRVFVYIHTLDSTDKDTETRLAALVSAGHPVIVRTLDDPNSLGEEFFVWEFATAVAGVVLQINPFDQPNVQESKDNTRRLLEGYAREGNLPEQEVLAGDNGIRLHASAEMKTLLAVPALSDQTAPTAASVIALHLASVRAGDYVALTAYIEETVENDRALEQVRARIRDRLRVATTVGYGPRFLHSTGQFHKGGPPTGVFIQITSDDAEEVPIPDRPYTFSTLKQAQALGDFQSLAGRSLRAIRFHARRDVSAGLEALLDAVRRR
ncbi:MAG TPA: transaldolase, partial [Blastocatellia bacterium]|nr:transaldolase [Blastocatellia bacterium]